MATSGEALAASEAAAARAPSKPLYVVWTFDDAVPGKLRGGEMVEVSAERERESERVTALVTKERRLV